MTKKEVQTTSGAITGLTESTIDEKIEATSWSSRSVTVTVNASSRTDKVTAINERLRGGISRGISTAG